MKIIKEYHDLYGVADFSFISCLTNDDLYQQFKRTVLYTPAGIFPIEKNIEFIQIYDVDSIFRGYNIGGKEAKGKILCFAHQDMRFLAAWHERIEEVMSEKNVGVVGFAGTKYLDNAVWWRHPEFSVGRLIQGEGELRFSNIEESHLEKVAVVDGYCFFVSKAVFDAVGGFNEQYGSWHFYDLDFSMKVHNFGYNNYVCDILTQHLSGGKTDEDWHRSSKIFLSLWQEKFPVRVA